MEMKRDPVAEEKIVGEMFSVLVQESGLKPTDAELFLHNRLEKVFEGRTDSPMIGRVFVDVDLAREKDKKLQHRVALAKQVQDVVNEELSYHLSPEGTLDLFARVLLVSDGSSGASRRFTTGVGTAKVTLAYCLLDRDAGQEVALASTVYHSKSCQGLDLDNYWELSSALVRSLASSAAQHIISQITFHLQQWKSHFKENHDLLEKIEAKLAQEENLNEDEYAFAARHNLL